MSAHLGYFIESFVAILLLVTICYCVLVNRKLKSLRADQGGLREIVKDLAQATAMAEAAIGKLKLTVGDAQSRLITSIEAARELETNLSDQLRRGQDLQSKLTTIGRHAAQAHTDGAGRAPARAEPQRTVSPEWRRSRMGFKDVAGRQARAGAELTS